jgi:hypothetical protein
VSAGMGAGYIAALNTTGREPTGDFEVDVYVCACVGDGAPVQLPLCNLASSGTYFIAVQASQLYQYTIQLGLVC